MKKCIAVLLTLCLMLSLCGFSAKVTLKGSGTEKDPYLISNAKELQKAAALLNDKDTFNDYYEAHYRLTADIDLGGKKWEPILWFKGVFDGDGHTISGLKVKYSKAMNGFYGAKETDFGLFAELSDAVVRDLTIRDSSFAITTKAGSAGALAGHALDTVIENCHVADSVTVSAPSQAGGLIGSASDGQIIGCTNAAAVTSTDANAGGIAAMCDSIRECVNSGTITAADNAGGIAATLNSSATNCENTGKITAQEYAGGICATFGDGALSSKDNDNTVTMKACTNSGTVTSEADPAGGITAKASAGSIVECINTGAVTSGDAEAGGIAGFFQPSPFGTPAETFSIENCENSGEVIAKAKTANEPAGGILGYIYACDTEITIHGCTNSGKVDAEGVHDVFDGVGEAGGILGGGRVRMLTITDCINSGDVTGATYAGGIVGEAEPADAETESTFLAENCTNSGTVNAIRMSSKDHTAYAGGILGFSRSESDTNGIFQSLEITGCKNTGKLTGTTGKVRTDNIQAGE